jgi:integrase
MIWSTKSKRDGVTYWHVRYDRPGGRTKETVPPILDAEGKVARWPSKQDARDFLLQRKAEVLAGTWRDPHAAPEPEREPERGPTFAKFVETFLKDHPGRRRSDHYTDTTKRLVARFGDRYLREITRADLDQFGAELLTKPRGPAFNRRERGPDGAFVTVEVTPPPLSPTTVLKILRTAGRVFRMAARWGEIKTNPAFDLDKPSPARGRLVYLTREQFDRVAAEVPPWIRPMVHLAVSTGMRLGEIVTLEWGNVDFGAGVLHVAENTKTGSRPVPMTAAARAILSAVPRGIRSPWVFVDAKGYPYHGADGRDRISRYTTAAMRRAGIAGATFHSLRHTCASWLAQSGVPLYEIGTMLGHSTPEMTKRYAHLAPSHMKAAVAALDKALGAEGPCSVPNRAGPATAAEARTA